MKLIIQFLLAAHDIVANEMSFLGVLLSRQLYHYTYKLFMASLLFESKFSVVF